ncbi:MAG: Yip1 family protein [bacterium]
MTPAPHLAARPRLSDFVRPRTLFAALDGAPTFILPMFALVAAALVYTTVAFRIAFPMIAPAMLSQATVTESELRSSFQLMLLVGSSIVPIVLTFLLGAVTWIVLRLLGGSRPYSCITSLVAWSSLWITIGLFAKTALAWLTRLPDPPLNLSFLSDDVSPGWHAIFALTNPFVILAVIWTVWGLREWGVVVWRRWIAGSLPWLALTAAVGTFSAGGERLTPSEPVDTSDYSTYDIEPITFRCPPQAKKQEGETIAKITSGVVQGMAEKLGFTARPITVVAFPDHSSLERATGEFLHVQVVGSIRGKSLLYVEMPGTSAAVPSTTGLREIMRWALIMELAPNQSDAPRWWVHGLAHARVYPPSPELESAYRSILARRGIPSYENVLDPQLFLTPDGPLLARALIDHLAFFYGIDAVEAIAKDLAAGETFRDALYAHTRLTTSALEAGWQDHARTLLEIERESSGEAAVPEEAGSPDRPRVIVEPIPPDEIPAEDGVPVPPGSGN